MLLNESIKEFAELSKLADEIIETFGWENSRSAKSLFKDFMSMEGEFDFEFEKTTFNLIDCVDNYKDYGNYDQGNSPINVQDFILGNMRYPYAKGTKDKGPQAAHTEYQSLKIRWTISTKKGVYLKLRSGNESEIVISIPDETFEDSLRANFWTLNNKYGKEPPLKEIVKSFIESVKEAYKPVLLHELRHAMDDFKSGGKYSSDKDSEEYYNRKGYNPIEKERQYYRLPHEYWARLTAILPTVADERTVKDAVATMAKNIIGWEYIPEDGRRRLIRATYKFWKEKNQQTS